MTRKIDEYCIETECGGQESCVVCTGCGQDVFLDGFEPLREEVLDKTLESLEKANRVRRCAECNDPVIICANCLTESSDNPICGCCFDLDDLSRSDMDDDLSFYGG